VLHKEIPFLRIIVPLILGIITDILIMPPMWCIYISGILAFSGFLLSLFCNRYLVNYVFGLAVFMAFFSCGILLHRNEEKRITELDPKKSLFFATLSDFPEEKPGTFMLTVKLSGIKNEDILKNVGGSMILYHRKDSSVLKMVSGDILAFECTPIEITNRGNPYEFDYKYFMLTHGIKYYAFTGKTNIKAITIPLHRKLRYRALIARERIIEMFRERGIKEERIPLVSAITLGQKNNLDQDIKQAFVNAGIMHIMAVSGLHAVILSLFVFRMLFFLKGRLNIFRVIITIGILWAFAFITGLTPSVLRATLMFTAIQTGNLMKRKVNGINSVLASAFILILIQPSVITDAGFLLSYSAVLYIIGFYNELYGKIQIKRWLPDKIWQSVAVTIIAQTGTLPLTILLFNRFPVYFILTNVIIVPLSSLLIIVGCLIPLTYPMVPVSELLASVMDKLTWLTEFLTRKAAALPYSTIKNIGITTSEALILSIALTLLVIFFLNHKRLSIKYPLFFFLLFLLFVAGKNLMNSNRRELIVYSNPAITTIGIQTGNTLNIMCSADTLTPEVIRHSAVCGLKINRLKELKYLRIYKTGSQLIVISDTITKRLLDNFKADILIISGEKPFFERDIPPGSLPRCTIVSSDCPSGFRLAYKLPLPGSRTICYIRKSGAFVARL
jgi:competence protein ComEC